MRPIEGRSALRSLEQPLVSSRYGEAASYRSSRWIQKTPVVPWIARHKPRNVSPFTNLFAAINESQAMTALPDDWDDAGSSAIAFETWERASGWIKSHAAVLWGRRGVLLPIPRILPGPDGSIDIHWKTGQRELLLNFPAAPDDSVTYYGDDFGSNRRKGALELGALDMDLFLWLTMTD